MVPLTELGRLAQAGSADALDQLLRRLDGPVLRYLAARLHAAADARDLALDLRQEVLVRVMRSLGRCTFASDGRLLAWVFTIARNVLLDHLRQARGRAEIRGDAHWDRTEAAGLLPGDDPAPARLLEACAAEALSEVPEATAELLRLRLVGGRSWKEVGDALGITESAAKRRFQRAQSTLRRQILARVDALPSEARLVTALRLHPRAGAPRADGAASRSPDAESRTTGGHGQPGLLPPGPFSAKNHTAGPDGSGMRKNRVRTVEKGGEKTPRQPFIFQRSPHFPSGDTIMATSYTVIFVNNSSQLGDACIFQQDPDITVPNVMSLAWFSKAAAPSTRIAFSWSIEYDFVWSETGTLVPGVVFSASQTWPADLTTENQVTFTNVDGAYTFQDQKKGARSGSLYIAEGGSIPVGQASVGIGMSGFGTFVVQAQPNMNLVFTPHPEYWISFGNFVQGEVMEISAVNNPAQIEFPPNVYSMTAILNSDNTWTIQTTAQVNKLFVEARKQDPSLAWGQHAERLLSAGRREHVR